MSDGITRSDGPYVWPEKLVQSPRPPQLVYLDLNHWISLAKCMSGHKDGGRYQDSLDICIRALESGQAIFPLSDSTYVEVNKIRRHSQRKDLLQAIEMLSRFFVVTSRTIIYELEIEALFDSRMGTRTSPAGRVNYLDWGVARAFGMVGGFRVYDESDNDVTEEAARTNPMGYENFMTMLNEAELKFNRVILEGPTEAEESELRALGWRPEGVTEIASRRLEQEKELVEKLNNEPRWRRGRTRDVITVREMEIELAESLAKELLKRDTTFAAVFPTRNEARFAFDAMPSFDVSVTMKTAYHRDSNHVWTQNDIHDIDALASTVPYCDFVVTDKAAATHINRAGISDRVNTRVLHSLDELSSHLEIVMNE